ncbi:putative inorganic phosphate cotransporter [Anthonomus grandis grandis]|uniref:putative inorganic phosphate cotransporter n=1 Tax=Anthonomus grandis grandis TaxID=2921223 RepID=UPI0021665049|nr:putative inorganic phosphate cotransporter [Anthonomus grandis grandis]
MGNIKNDSKNYVEYSVVKDDIKTDIEQDYDKAPGFGKRHIQVLLYFLFLFIGYGFRVNLSVAIVAMTDPKASINPDVPTYPQWTQKGAILSAFFWGYIWPQILAGYMASRFGGKWFLTIFFGIQSVIGFCTPFIAARFGEIGMMVMRTCQGLCQGFLFPTITHLLSQWVPHEERARMANYAFSSVPFGTVIGILLTGIISESRYGWPMVYYIYGISGIFIVISFIIFGYNSPADHPKISESERNFIEKSLGHTNEKSSHKVPWKSIFTSKPVFALLCVQCGFIFGFWVLLSQIPTFMKHVLNFNIKSNSILSCLPYFMLFLFGFPLAFLSDYITNNGYISQTNSRKLFNFLGLFLPSIALVMVGYVRPDQATKAVWLLILAVSLGSLTNCGWAVNHMDLSPNFAGPLMGICNGAANIMAIFAPLSVQFLVKDIQDPRQWRIIFYIAATIQILAGIIFQIWGSAEVQPWNEPDKSKRDSKNEENIKLKNKQ